MDMSKIKRTRIEKKLKKHSVKRRKDVNTERKQINEIVHEALKDENRDNEKLFQILWEVGKESWKSLYRNFTKRFAGHVLEEDLEMAAKEGLYYAITRLKPTSNPFSYLRLCVKGFVMDWVTQNAFPVVMGKKEDRIENMQVIRLNHEGLVDDDDDNDNGEDIIAELIYHEAGFEEIEIRDMINKLLSFQEKSVVNLLMDGYTEEEIARILKISKREVLSIMKSVRKKFMKEMGLDGQTQTTKDESYDDKRMQPTVRRFGILPERYKINMIIREELKNREIEENGEQLTKRRYDINIERCKINAIVHEFLKDGNYDKYKLFETLWVIGRDTWMLYCVKYMNHFAGYVQREDLDLAAMEGLYYAITKLKPTTSPFDFLRKYVQGFILNWITKNAFPIVVWVQGKRVMDVEAIKLNFEGFVEKDDEDADDEEDCLPELYYYEHGYEEVEIRDLIEKLLSSQEKTIVNLLMDGYSQPEVAKLLGITSWKLNEIMKKVREKLGKEFNCLRGDGNGRVSH